jgi:hypothetical protein
MDKDEFSRLENLMWKKWSTYTACASAHSLCNIEQYNKASTEYYNVAKLYQLARKEMGLDWIISDEENKS